MIPKWQLAENEKVAWGPGSRSVFLYILIGAGLITMVYYFSWWATVDHLTSPLLVLGVALMIGYSIPQVLGVWSLYLAARPSPGPSRPVRGALSVNVFVVTYNEPYPVVQRCLQAACEMRGAHRTWLLDDGGDAALAHLATGLGAGYLHRSERTGNKPGNLNSALARTDGDIIVIFDIDHAPEPDFLERTLGYFADPRIGFVQVMLTFCNHSDGWIAKAASEASYDFYNPTSLGMDAVGSATLMGSNALIRRAALESIDGYQYGLADDLATSLALHAAGWQSAYVAAPLAPGLVPPDARAWFIQQLKWARGVFEIQLTSFRRLSSRLTWGQRLSYAVRLTYYWAGPVIAVHLLVTAAVLFTGSRPALVAFDQYLVHLVPFALVSCFIRGTAIGAWLHPALPPSLAGRAITLVYGTWPVYTLAWVGAMLRLSLQFRLTPKERAEDSQLFFLLPQILTILLLATGLLYAYSWAGTPIPSLLLAWTVGQIVLHSLFLYGALLKGPSRWQAPNAAEFSTLGVD